MKISLLSTANGFILRYMIEAFWKHGVDIHSLLLDKKKFSARNAKIFQERTGGKLPPFDEQTLRSFSFPAYDFPSHNSDECISFIHENEIDLLINAGTHRILTKDLLDAPKIGVLNCHPGLIPEYQGCSCTEWALYHDTPVGNTVHFMTENIDDGPMVTKEETPIEKTDGYQDIRTKVYLHSCDLMARAVKEIVLGNIKKEDCKPSGKGNYYQPMPDETFAELMERFERKTVSTEK